MKPSFRFAIPLFIMLMFQQNSPAADWSKEYCSGDNVVCIIYEQNGNTVDIYLRNKLPVDGLITTITLEQSGKFKNIECNTRLPVTVVCNGTGTVKAASLTIKDISRAWDAGFNWFWQYGSSESQEDARYIYSLPYGKGKRFRVCQGFNDKPTHFGDYAYSIDWLMPEGTPICAARGGVVVNVVDQYDGGGFSKEYMNKNNTVQILHDDGTVAQYNHIKKNGAAVKTGDRVSTGDVIAYSGNVGYSGGPHLHFSVFKPVNGKKSMSIPVGFATDYSDYEILQKSGIYTFTGASPKKKMPLIFMEDLAFCRDVVNGMPVNIADSFSTKDRFKVYVPVCLKSSHRIQMIFYKNNNTAPVLNYSWTLKKEWDQAVTDVDLSKIPDSQGAWKVVIIFDNETVGTKEFTVTAAR